MAKVGTGPSSIRQRAVDQQPPVKRAERAAAEVVTETKESKPAESLRHLDIYQAKGDKVDDQQAQIHDRQLAARVVETFVQKLGARDERSLLARLQALTQAVDAAATRGAGAPTGEATPAVRAAMREAYGPVGDILFCDSAQELVGRKDEIATQAKLEKRFNDRLGKLDTLEDVMGLEQAFAGEPLPPHCRNALLKAYMNKASGKDTTAFEHAARFYEASVETNPAYKSDEIGREYYIVCLNKAGRADHSITEAQLYIAEVSGLPPGADPLREISADTARSGTAVNGEVLAALGKAHSLKGDLDASTRCYEAGFVTDFEYYPGIVAVYNNYEKGDAERAEQLAPIVWSACQQAGGKDASDYWCLATQVELSLITHKDTDFAELLPRMLKRANVDWELSSTVDKMEMLAGLREQKGEDTTLLRYATKVVKGRIKELSNYSSALKEAKEQGGDAVEKVQARHQRKTDALIKGVDEGIAKIIPKRGAGAAAAVPSTDDARAKITEAILGSSGDFRAMTSSHAVGGNVAWGGQIPDMTVTRGSVRVVRDLLNEWGLDKVQDFDSWNKVVNARLNEMLDLQDASGRRPLEDLHSKEHDVLDGYDKNRFELCATDVSGDSRTDLLAIMALGIGDCRPTAFAKQLLFDVWQRDQCNTLMRDAFDAATAGDTGKRDAALDRVGKLQRQQLRTVTAQIDAPIQMHEMYKHVEDPETGRPVADAKGEYQAVENHTFNLLVELDDDGEVKDEVRCVDGFYQQLYPLGDLKLDAKQILSEGGFDGGAMGVRDSKGREIPFRIKPTAYSGALLKEFEVGSSDFRYCGQTVAPATFGTMFGQRERLNGLARQIADLQLGEEP